MIKLKREFLDKFINQSSYNEEFKRAEHIEKTLIDKKNSGEPLGWLDFASKISDIQIEKIESLAKKIRSNSKNVLLIGIGGSYLGARAIIDGLNSSFSKEMNFFYAGYHLDEEYHRELVNHLSDKDFSIICISKSGSTIEPALAFRTFFQILQKRYETSKLKDYVFLITDKQKGNLRKFGLEYGLESLEFPTDIGGRYSVVTPVGLLPIATANISIRDFLDGFKTYELEVKKDKTALEYACLRNMLHQKGKLVEIFVSSSPYFYYFSEWWKQLFGESEGKEGKGIFPVNASFTTDLHSLGQYLQEGKKHFFETFLEVEKKIDSLRVSHLENDLDGLNYLENKAMCDINEKAIKGTLMAHSEESPCLVLSILEKNPKNLGALMYFFKYSCAISAYLLGVNPFDQPGVEKYKQNMNDLLKS